MTNSFSRILCCGSNAGDYAPIPEKQPLNRSTLDERAGYEKTKPLSIDDTDTIAFKAIAALVRGDDQPLKAINNKLSRDAVRATSWAESLAESILSQLIEVLKPGNPIGDALREIHDRVHDSAMRAFELAKEHPYWTTAILVVIAVGMLCLMAPWVVHCLGFARAGVQAGSWAAEWQSTMHGVILEDSLFSWLQSFGALY